MRQDSLIGTMQLLSEVFSYANVRVIRSDVKPVRRRTSRGRRSHRRRQLHRLLLLPACALHHPAEGPRQGRGFERTTQGAPLRSQTRSRWADFGMPPTTWYLHLPFASPGLSYSAVVNNSFRARDGSRPNCQTVRPPRLPLQDRLGKRPSASGHACSPAPNGLRHEFDQNAFRTVSGEDSRRRLRRRIGTLTLPRLRISCFLRREGACRY